jgi:drug/metabolite transporter (DMT)-like permease
MGLLSTAAGYIVYFALLARAGATNVLLATLLIPPSALLLGALFLAESVEPRDAAGLAFIAGGLAAIDGRPLHWLSAIGYQLSAQVSARCAHRVIPMEVGNRKSVSR